jgi:lipopolysaccharide export system permease protein
MPAPDRLPRRSFGAVTLIDRYLLASMAPPMAASFAVVLVALLLYRLLEIFNLLAASSAQFDLALKLIGALLPHYLGLALPASYFISVFIVIARMGDNSEVDALLASGVSMERLAAPFIAAGAVISVASLILLGFVQPHGRYDYNQGLNEALGSSWNARLEPRTFISPSEDFVITADAVDPTGRVLSGVFVRRIDGDGQEQIITARAGLISPTPDKRRVTLVLTDVAHLQDRDGSPAVGRSSQLQIEAPAAAARGEFRARGSGARELTSVELFQTLLDEPDADRRRRAASEFHTRAVRSISPLFLPLLALPLGMAAKRRRRSAGFIVAAVVLLLYQHAIDTAQAVSDSGQVEPVQAIWTPFALFATLCLGLFLSSRNRPGETPFNAIIDALAEMLEAVQSRLTPRRRPSPR